MVSTLAPSIRQKAASLSTAAASVPAGGVRMHQRPTKSSAKPASGPECSVPATGCAGTKCTPGGKCGPMSRTMAVLTEPTSETIPPRIRQLIGGRLPQDQPARREEGVGVLGRAPLGVWKMDQQKVGDARRHFQAELANFLRQPIEPARVVLARAFLMRDVLDRSDAGGDRRPADVERATNAVDRI